MEKLQKKSPNLNPFEIAPIIENILIFLNYPDLISAEKINREWQRATLVEWRQRKSIDFRRLLDSDWAPTKKNTEKRQETIIEEALDWLHKRCPNLTQLCDLRHLFWLSSFNRKIAKFHSLTKLEIFGSTRLVERDSHFRVISLDFLVLLRQLAPNLQVFVIHDFLTRPDHWSQDDSEKIFVELTSIFCQMKSLVCLELDVLPDGGVKVMELVCKLPAPEKLEILKIFQCFHDCHEMRLHLELSSLLKRARHLKKFSTSMFLRHQYTLGFLQSLPSSIEELIIPLIGDDFNQSLKDDIAAEFHRLGNLKKLIMKIPADDSNLKIILENLSPKLTTLGRFNSCRTLKLATQFKQLKEVVLPAGLMNEDGLIGLMPKIESLEFVNLPGYLQRGYGSRFGSFIEWPFAQDLRRCKPYEGVPLSVQKLTIGPLLSPDIYKQVLKRLLSLYGRQLKELWLSSNGNKEDLKILVEKVADSCPNLEKFHLMRYNLLRQLCPEAVDEESEKPFWFLTKKCPKLHLLAFSGATPPVLSRGTLPSSVQVHCEAGLFQSLNYNVATRH